MASKIIPNKVLQFAKEYGYDDAVFKCEWNGYSICEPIQSDAEDMLYIGEPQFILYKMGKVRFSELDEYSNFVKYMPE